MKDPIFILGPGKTGLSLLHQILSQHPNVSWFSSILEKYPKHIFLNKLVMLALSTPIVKRIADEDIIPSEANNFWELHCKDFKKQRYLGKEDITIEIKKNLPRLFQKTITAKRNRLIVKHTGWPHIEFLNEIFNDAIFINVIRDPRATAYSLAQTDFLLNPEVKTWRIGPLTPKYTELWNAYNKSTIILGLLHVKMFNEAYEKAINNIPLERIYTIRYEELCQKPDKELTKLLAFLKLPYPTTYKKLIEEFSFSSTNSKWQYNLPYDQQKSLQIIYENLFS